MKTGINSDIIKTVQVLISENNVQEASKRQNFYGKNPSNPSGSTQCDFQLLYKENVQLLYKYIYVQYLRVPELLQCNVSSLQAIGEMVTNVFTVTELRHLILFKIGYIYFFSMNESVVSIMFTVSGLKRQFQILCINCKFYYPGKGIFHC